MPRTFIRSSTFLNPPFFCRYSRMRSAVAFPIPGSVSSCATVAVFRLIGPAGASAAAALAAGRAASCADTPRVTSPSTRTIAVIIRIMCCLLSAAGRPRPARRKRAELKGTVRVDLPHGSLREKAPDEHDGVSRALVEPRRTRRDDRLMGKPPAARLQCVLIAELSRARGLIGLGEIVA